MDASLTKCGGTWSDANEAALKWLQDSRRTNGVAKLGLQLRRCAPQGSIRISGVEGKLLTAELAGVEKLIRLVRGK